MAVQTAINETSLSDEQLSGFSSRRTTSRINVSDPERWLSMLAGGALAMYGLRRRTLGAGTAALAGAALVYRGVTGYCPVYGALNLNTASHSGPPTSADKHSDTRQELGGPRGMHVSATVTIARPVAEVYRFWRNFENLPRFMQHLESVAQREEGISHWVARGPAGMPVEWDARIINEVENKLIGWQSLEGSTISTAGSVNFRETGDGRTEVHVRFQYQPPAGSLGAAVAWLFGAEPNTTVREDLQRLKQILEGGSPSEHPTM